MPTNRKAIADTAENATGKRCLNCGRVKPPEEFYWKNRWRRRENTCKSCLRIYHAAWREQHPRVREGDEREHYLAYQKLHSALPKSRERRQRNRQTPIGKLINQRTTVRRRLRLKPTAILAQ